MIPNAYNFDKWDTLVFFFNESQQNEVLDLGQFWRNGVDP